MNQSRKTRQPDRFMLYMTLTLLLWVVVFVVVLLTQVTNPVGTPPATDASRPDAPRNPFSSGQFASPEDSQFIPRPRRLDPVQLPPARAYTSIVFGDASFNVINPESNNFAAQLPATSALATDPESATLDASSNPADTTSDTTPNITQDTTPNITQDTTHAERVAEPVADSVTANINAEGGDNEGGDNNNSGDIATAEVNTTNVDTTHVDTAKTDATANVEATAVNAVDNTSHATPDTSSDVPNTPPAASLEVIAVEVITDSNQTSTPPDNTQDNTQDNMDVTADDTRRVANITPPEQTDIASAHADTAKAEGITADTALGVSNASTAVTTDTTTAANSTSTFPEDIRLEPPPLLPTNPAPATADLITVTFSSQPSGAEVIVEDEVIGTTPLELRLPANQDIFYTLAVPSSSSGTSGFRRFSSVVRSPEDTAVAIQLEPISNVPTASIEGFGTISALRGNRANAQVVRDAVATLLEQAVTEYQAAISDSRIARLQAEIDALEAELARLDAVLATPAEPND